MASVRRLNAESAPIYILSGLLAVALGWIASTGSLPAAAVVTGLLGGIILLVQPTLLLWSVLFGGLVVSGLAMLYAPQLQLVRWAVAIASVFLVVLALVERISQYHSQRENWGSLIAWQLIALFGVVLLSGWANGQGATQLIIGVKSYFQVVGLFFALVMMTWPKQVIDALPRIMLYIAFLQLPFVLHQYLYLVPRRMGYGEGVVPYDVVAGTFGASLFGGGANAVLSAFLLIVVAVLLALWNNRAISLTRLLLFSLPLMTPIFVNESKVSILYLLIIVLIIFKNEIMLRPLRAILSGALLAVLLTGLMVAYSAYYADQADGADDLISGTIQQNFSSDQGHGGFYLNRWSTLTFWIQEHSAREPIHALIGHGPRASREGGDGLDAGGTLASRRYPGMGIGLTGVSAVLWEAGLLGLIAVGGMFVVAFQSAGALRRRFIDDPYRSGLFSGLQAGVVILMLSMFHKSFFVFDIGYQTILMLLFGFLAYYTDHSMRDTEQRVRIPSRQFSGR
jgi:hypothetical protein